MGSFSIDKYTLIVFQIEGTWDGLCCFIVALPEPSI